ncbi:MAG: DUF370 domain-containing protein [Clostridia bacterium]|nr:DUF370 domain-containing protein [Clostridia bacterium]
MKLLNIGFGNMVCIDRIIAIVVPESAPIKRIVSESKDRGLCIDATYGRKTRTVLITDTDHVILSALQPETLRRRAQNAGDDKNAGAEQYEEETDDEE